ncbi:hypothetical protein CIB48_g4818 [Xylaria polymorpha]|nr:hypothetical protein CIB48_g4818 [Xylaria polymorpha]
MTYPIALPLLTPSEAVTDPIYRALLGIDKYDVAMFNSAFVGDNLHFEIRDKNTNVIESVSAWRKELLEHIGPMDTTHMLSNVRVYVEEGSNNASLTASIMAQHALPGQGKDPSSPKFLVGAQYEVDLVKDGADGLWKIKTWLVDIIWSQGDASIMPKY